MAQVVDLAAVRAARLRAPASGTDAQVAYARPFGRQPGRRRLHGTVAQEEALLARLQAAMALLVRRSEGRE